LPDFSGLAGTPGTLLAIGLARLLCEVSPILPSVLGTAEAMSLAVIQNSKTDRVMAPNTAVYFPAQFEAEERAATEQSLPEQF
jgi:hypothetical protein